MISASMTPNQRGLFDMLTEKTDQNHASFTMDTAFHSDVLSEEQAFGRED
jgi:hypothetical protein